ncbi:putative transposon-derived protein F52C9.6 [Aphis craccivora]|uniref:Putative transposon-derived protein F52C9.6 n=1 Tax=Aphis craccivora TaxID=307492 RepID=A0A6G0W2P5_APHCR|nr:putative transposon-derived protein F52C9.6 [Aphis craccivora]KAF0772825.1 putative transposon-derived protein F52C9.6 [Aphis craccivora]
MGLSINEEKTKFMILSRRNVNQSNLKVGSMNFEKVDNFKYLGVNINNSNNMHNEIKERIANGNRCYFSINKLLRSKLLSRKSKTTLYTSYLRPVVTYGCETWSTTKDDNRKLAIWERRILRNIYGPVYNDNLGIYEKRHNEELYDLYGKPNILTYIRCKRLEWLGHVWRADGDLLKNVLIRKIDKKRPLGRPRTRWKDTAEKDMRLIDKNATLDWTLNREKWRGLLVAAQVLNGPLSC